MPDYFQIVETHPSFLNILEFIVPFYHYFVSLLFYYFFKVINFHGTHGEMFLYPKWVALISDKIKERCGGDGK